jgi:hypothetical protein
MLVSTSYLHILAVFFAAGCANAGGEGPSDDGVDASCGDQCDQDGDGVFDGMDRCADTPAGSQINSVGCADSQVDPQLEPMFPPYQLMWTSGGDIGRAGGLTWTYAGIDRGDLFHIYWIVCDDPGMPCGVSLNGPVDAPGESWTFSAMASDLPAGKLSFSNATSISLEGMPSVALSGRLTLTIVDAADVPLPFATVAVLGVHARAAGYGAEIPGTGYKVTALIEVKDAMSPFTPYLDYYDAAPTAMGASTSVSFGASFYDE